MWGQIFLNAFSKALWKLDLVKFVPSSTLDDLLYLEDLWLDFSVKFLEGTKKKDMFKVKKIGKKKILELNQRENTGRISGTFESLPVKN